MDSGNTPSARPRWPDGSEDDLTGVRPTFEVHPAAPSEQAADVREAGRTGSGLDVLPSGYDRSDMGYLPEVADLEGQPERSLVVDDYSSQVLLGNPAPSISDETPSRGPG